MALDHPYGVIGAGSEKNVANHEIGAAIKQQMIWAMVAADPGRRQNIAAGTVKLRALAINRAQAFDENIFGVYSVDQCNVAITQRRVPAERDRINCAVLPAVDAAQQFSLGCQAQCDIALQLDRSNDEHSRGHENRSTLILVASVNR